MLKVHVWAGISARGATKICILFNEIFEEKFQGSGNRFMQDNNLKHK